MGILKAFIKPKVPVDNNAYFYSRLNDEQKNIYVSMHSGIHGYAKKITLPMRPLNEISLIFHAILADNPMLFYISSYQVQTDLYKSKCFIYPKYEYSRTDIKAHSNAVYENLRTYDAVADKSDAEKEQFVHDYCLKNFTFGDTGSESYSILGLVLNKTAVCGGIADYVKVALDYLGVRSLIVSGKAQNPFCDDKMENHAWNIVKIDGKAYHLDVTFDMTVAGKIPRYDYFNLCDDDIRKDHVIIGNIPKCTTAGKDYYSANNMTAQGWSGLESFISRKIQKGKKSVVVKLTGITPTNDVADRVMQIVEQQYMKINGTGASIKVGYNPSQMVFEIDFK
jgi:hypothetical protein